MYKKYTAYKCGASSCFVYKFLLIMKLTLILMVAALLQVRAASYAQKISIEKKDAQLADVLNEIREQSGYSFLYNTQMLQQARPVTFSVKNATITQTLDKVFAKQPFSYVINQNTVIVTPKPESKELLLIASTVTGRVTDDHNQPLPGVTVRTPTHVA